jgi:hypothetical protein
MDSTRFDRLATALTGETGRRDTLRLLGASLLGVGGLAVLGAAEGDARKKGKNKKKKNKGKGKGNGKDTCQGRCGGQCPRCALGTTCSTRDECTTALCSGGVCSAPVSNVECGTDTDGNICATRAIDGVVACTRIAGRFLNGGSCSQCTGTEVCFIPNNQGVECIELCGSPV